MKIIIREPVTNEIDQVKDVTQLAYQYPFDEKDQVISHVTEQPNLADLFIRKELNILVATIDDKIIGAIRYTFPDNKTAHFSRLVVLKDYRGQGIAKKLIQQVETIAKQSGANKVKLDFMQEKNLAPFYESLDYHITKIIEHGSHHDVFATKDIK
jgi:ribosomal protein S18 acetylase RimI-like enzyme